MRSTVVKVISSQFFKRILTYGFSDALSKLAPFLVLPIILKVLSPEEFGLVSNFAVLSSFFFPFIMLNGHTFYSVRYYETSENQRNNSLNTASTISIFMFLVIALLLFATPLSNYLSSFYKLSHSWILLCIFLAFLKSIVFLFQTYLRFSDKVNLFAKLRILDSLISAGMAILFVVILGLGWQGRVSAIIISVFFSLAFLIFYYDNKLSILTFNFSYIKEQLRFSIPLIPHSISSFGKVAVERGLITITFGLLLNGVLASVGVFSLVITVISNAVFSTLNPEILKTLNSLYKDDYDLRSKSDFTKRIVRLSWFGLGIITLAIMLAYPLGYVFFTYFLDSNYTIAFEYLPFILIIAFFQTLYSHFSIYLISSKKTSILSVVTSVNIIIYVLILVIFINEMSIVQYLLVSVVSTILMVFSLVLFTAPYIPFKFRKYFDVF